MDITHGQIEVKVQVTRGKRSNNFFLQITQFKIVVQSGEKIKI